MATTTAPTATELEIHTELDANVQSTVSDIPVVDNETSLATSRLADSTVPDGGYG